LEKKRLSKILAGCDAGLVARLYSAISEKYGVTVVKGPGKTLAMLKMRETVRGSLYYLGETIVSQAIVEVSGQKGMAVLMGDDLDKALYMAAVDAAFNAGLPECADYTQLLLSEEKKQQEAVARDNAMYMKTTVNFQSMDSLTTDGEDTAGGDGE
jgi:alpha-D-ribose 1-methylphosphonate 5-triphosphate synthase subunit PhnG